MKRYLVLFLFSVLPVLAHSQVLKLNQGDFEVAGSAVIDRAEIGFNARVGTFIMDYIQVGGNVQWIDSNFATRTGLNLYGIRLYETGTYFLPYAGASLGFGSLDFDFGGSNNGLELHAIGGVKYYLADNVSLNTELSLGVSTDDTFLGDKKTESTEVALRVGISFFW